MEAFTPSLGLHHLVSCYQGSGSTTLNGGEDIFAEVQQIASLKLYLLPFAMREMGLGDEGKIVPPPLNAVLPQPISLYNFEFLF